MIRRLQRRIAEQWITPEEIAIYFIRYDREQAIIEEINIDLFGNILNWPGNFFGDDLEDLSAMTKAARNRKQTETNA
ncbi:MAG: DUF3696 domain-containing protein [Bacteroidales bacterium]|nr:DUF3696 domain-containing protein [Bacteroidales bacterium]